MGGEYLVKKFVTPLRKLAKKEHRLTVPNPCWFMDATHRGSQLISYRYLSEINDIKVKNHGNIRYFQL